VTDIFLITHTYPIRISKQGAAWRAQAAQLEDTIADATRSAATQRAQVCTHMYTGHVFLCI
jgi:hypothetical protein